jgi:hypothetical protein
MSSRYQAQTRELDFSIQELVIRVILLSVDRRVAS